MHLDSFFLEFPEAGAAPFRLARGLFVTPYLVYPLLPFLLLLIGLHLCQITFRHPPKKIIITWSIANEKLLLRTASIFDTCPGLSHLFIEGSSRTFIFWSVDIEL